MAGKKPKQPRKSQAPCNPAAAPRTNPFGWLVLTGWFMLVLTGAAAGIFVATGEPGTQPARSNAEPITTEAMPPAPAPPVEPTLELTLAHEPHPSEPILPDVPMPQTPAVAIVRPEMPPAPMVDPAPRLPAKPDPAPADASAAQRISFLGTVAEGKRFFFIADNSGSMNGVKMAMLKTELARTLQSLKPESQFYVTFFNSRTMPMPAKDWQQGGRDVPKALAWIASMGVGGDTNPQPAFEMALKAKPSPDVILFMTDGLIPANVPGRVRKLNQQDPKVVIHTILLDARNPQAPPVGLAGADAMLRQIAADSGGTYRGVVIPLSPTPVAVRPVVRPVMRPPLPVRRIP